jgi:hypothetical protein
MAKYCNKCWTSNTDDAYFCIHCRNGLKVETKTNVVMSNENKAPSLDSVSKSSYQDSPMQSIPSETGLPKLPPPPAQLFTRPEPGMTETVTINRPHEPLPPRIEATSNYNDQYHQKSRPDNPDEQKKQSTISPAMMEMMMRRKNQTPFFWVVTIILSSFGMLWILWVFTSAETVYQEISGAAVAIALAVVPYVLAKAIKELNNT